MKLTGFQWFAWFGGKSREEQLRNITVRNLNNLTKSLRADLSKYGAIPLSQQRELVEALEGMTQEYAQVILAARLNEEGTKALFYSAIGLYGFERQEFERALSVVVVRKRYGLFRVLIDILMTPFIASHMRSIRVEYEKRRQEAAAYEAKRQKQIEEMLKDAQLLEDAKTAEGSQ